MLVIMIVIMIIVALLYLCLLPSRYTSVFHSFNRIHSLLNSVVCAPESSLATDVVICEIELGNADIIEGEIVLMNISEYDLLVPATVKVGVPAARGLNQDESEIGEDAGETESGAVVRSEMTYHEFIPTNTLVTNRKTKNFRIPKDIRLAPGEVHRIPVTINTRDMNPGGTMFRTYTLECVLHSAEIRVGNQLFRGMVPFRPATAGVFPRNAEHLKDAPLKRMKQALQKNSPVHLTLAAAYVDRSNPQELAEVYEFLRTELEREDTLPENADGIMMALVIIADLRETKSKDDWITWLKNREWTRTNR